MKQVTTRKKCEHCEDGEMLGTGQGMANGRGTSWDHKCNVCGTRRYFENHYPRTHLEFTPEEKENRWEPK